MKRLLLTLTALTLAHSVQAQEPVPLENAQKGARMLTQTLTTASDLPLAIDVDLEKPNAFKAGEVAVMVIPDKHLTAEVLSGVKEAVVPLGQLWLYNLVPRLNGQLAAADKLRTLTVRDNEKDMRVQLYLIGAARNAQGALELVLYAKDKDPLARLPLRAGSGAAQDLPLQVSGHKEDEKTGLLTISILGKQIAEMLLQLPGE